MASRSLALMCICGLAYLVAPLSAQAQVIYNVPVWDAMSGEALALRLPGTMIDAGIQRHVDARNTFFTHPTITEVGREAPLVTQAYAESLRIVFQGLEDAITALQNVILIRGGRTPTALPDQIPSYAPDLNSDGSSDSGFGGILDDISGFISQATMRPLDLVREPS
jgi:hypothetical protein